MNAKTQQWGGEIPNGNGKFFCFTKKAAKWKNPKEIEKFHYEEHLNVFIKLSAHWLKRYDFLLLLYVFFHLILFFLLLSSSIRTTSSSSLIPSDANTINVQSCDQQWTTMLTAPQGNQKKDKQKKKNNPVAHATRKTIKIYL